MRGLDLLTIVRRWFGGGRQPGVMHGRQARRRLAALLRRAKRASNVKRQTLSPFSFLHSPFPVLRSTPSAGHSSPVTRHFLLESLEPRLLLSAAPTAELIASSEQLSAISGEPSAISLQLAAPSDSALSPQPSVLSPTSTPRLSDLYGALPLSFEANAGQTDDAVKFLSRGPEYTLFLTGQEAVLSLAAPAQAIGNGQGAIGEGLVLRLTLEGANLDAPMTGLDPLEGRVNYLIGDDPSQWHADVPTYQKVRYDDVYEGIDLVFYGNLGQLEYDWVVAPGADPHHIAFGIDGAQSATIDAGGNLELAVAGGMVEMLKPVAYQMIDGERVSVAAAYQLSTQSSVLSTVSLELGACDPSLPLIIDPVLKYSSYLGGSGSDVGNSLAVDSAGNAYIVGSTGSSAFPGTAGSSIQNTPSFGGDVFVTKFNANGSSILYSTYLGGTGFEVGRGIAVNAAGEAFVIGTSGSGNFPGTATSLIQNSLKGTQDGFVTKLNAAGSAILYSTYLGGVETTSDTPTDIEVDAAGNAYVTGYTTSSDFTGTSGSLLQNSLKGSQDAFVAKINAAGTALLYSTYVGGSGFDYGNALALDGQGNVYIG